MKNLTKILFLFIFLQGVSAKVTVSLDDPNLSYDGVFYPQISATKVVFNRHLPEMKTNWESGIGGEWINQWVITQTGIRIRFKTASPTIDLSFTKREGGGTIGASPSSGFTVFVNGVAKSTYSNLSFTITHPNPGIESTFEVSLPNLWAVDFTGMQLADGYSLAVLENLNKPVYVSIGNSITHGTGQYVSSAKTYPFILANKMGWDLHNIAVAGSTLGWAIALNLKGQKVDVITLKIGFNDWKYTKTDLTTKQKEYAKLLDSLRAFQPSAKIYCISPIFSSDASGAAPYSLADFRTMVDELVTARMQTDPLLCLIKGIEISDATLLASGDPTHLSEYGAETFANRLYTKINECDLTSSLQTVKKNNMGMQLINDSHLEIYCNYSGTFELQMISSCGKLVINKQVPLSEGENVISFDQEHFSPGIYIIKCIGKEGESAFLKVILR